VEGKQTYIQLANKHTCCLRTVQRRLDKAETRIPSYSPKGVIVLMDTTYFGRKFGVMLFKDALSGENLYKTYVKTETNQQYAQGIEYLLQKGFTINAIVCDGRRGLFQLFPGIPMQMCNFHQVAIIRRYLTKKPKMQASIELWTLALLLVRADKESFEGALSDWHIKWESFLNERRIDDNGKKRYIHKSLRSAFRSLKTNLPWLFTWYDLFEIGIPNTTNAIDGHFADLKNKLRNHNGLSIGRRKKFIDEFLKA
jgi:hypothetical protein